MSSARIDIGVPPDRVFSVLTDQSLLKLWQPEVIEVRQEGLGVGAVYHALVEEFGRRFQVRLLVTRWEKDTAIAYEMTTPMWSGNIEYLLKSQPQGTTLDFLFKPVQPRGWRRIPAVLVGMATRPMLKRIHRRRLEALRSVVEAHAQKERGTRGPSALTMSDPDSSPKTA
jgi:uncharacterized protein YndB with AHSA1/START domain